MIRLGRNKAKEYGKACNNVFFLSGQNLATKISGQSESLNVLVTNPLTGVLGVKIPWEKGNV